MLAKFILKNGFGSPGNTAKTLIEHFNRKNQLYMASEPNEVYESMISDRMLFSIPTGQSLYSDIIETDLIMEFIDNDISTFTFFVMFTESEDFRNGVLVDRYGNTQFNLVTEVIYEVCKKRSALCVFSLLEFRNKAVDIMKLKLYKSYL